MGVWHPLVKVKLWRICCATAKFSRLGKDDSRQQPCLRFGNVSKSVLIDLFIRL